MFRVVLRNRAIAGWLGNRGSPRGLLTGIHQREELGYGKLQDVGLTREIACRRGVPPSLLSAHTGYRFYFVNGGANLFNPESLLRATARNFRNPIRVPSRVFCTALSLRHVREY